jgi:cyanate permease
MLAQLFPVVAAILLVYVFMWLSVLAVDEGLDSHEAGLAVVAARTLSVNPTNHPH